MLTNELNKDLLLILSSPYLNPVFLTFLAICFLIGFYGTFALAFISVAVLKASTTTLNARELKFNDLLKQQPAPVLSIITSFLIPTIILVYGIVQESNFLITFGLIFYLLFITGIILGSRVRLDILKENGYTFKEGIINNLSIFVRFPSGTWENEISYIVVYSTKLVKKLIILLFLLIILQELLKLIK